MGVYVTKFQMQQFGNGWDYSFYWTGDSARSAVANAKGLVLFLMNCHSVHTICKSISAANVAFGSRETFSERVNELGKMDPAGAVTPDVVRTTARLKLYSTGHHFRQLYLRGLVDIQVNRNAAGGAEMGERLNQAVNSLIPKIKEHNFQIRVMNPATSDGELAWKQVVSIRPEPDTNDEATIIKTRRAHALQVDDQVVFKFDRSQGALIGFPGLHRVVENAVGAATTEFILNLAYRGEGESLTPRNMRVRKVTFSEVNIDSGKFQTFSTRDTGSARAGRGRSPGRSWRNNK